jgi:hypothetical protein
MGDDHYQCVHCKVEYLNKLGECINMFAFIKGKRLVLQIRPNHPHHPARIFHTGANMRDTQTFINLTFIPDITPQNIQKKLKLYLLFS